MDIINILTNSYSNVDNVNQQDIADYCSISFNSIEDVLLAGGFVTLVWVVASYMRYRSDNNLDNKTARKEFYNEMKVKMYEPQKYFAGIG